MILLTKNTMDFSKWTRQDFLDFDARRTEAMQPTLEELKAQEDAIEASKTAKYSDVLTANGFNPDSPITEDFVKSFFVSIDAKQYIWDVDKWIESQIDLYWNVETGFKNFILTNF